MRRAAKVDANSSTLLDYFRQAGCRVLQLHAVGRGCPDALLWWPRRDRWKLVEIKDGSKVPSAQRLTDDQLRFHGEWRGGVCVVASIAQAMAVLQELDRGN